ncbi:hypothetical protein EDD37DRAFT_613358 [Exophiala viscosa]|uniref:DUF7702 domain-containing protein n=1 Tax=Exophiala viscosa TaxID=2486360 RepID=A0AAN6DP08_9EURO|nr:hypothetical protein EDD36DRAFT_423633 [Exophiala viscosa]KAI1620101.1 hypothetical protein EDD37DRAFT_613358 [Exophiala viscosa]
MVHITYSDGVSIGRLAYYVPALFVSVVVIAKHGARRSFGWIFLTLFCLIRIIGSAAQLDTINNNNPKTPETIALICTVLGLSPLLLSTLGILTRVYHSILDQTARTKFSFVVRAIQIPATVALILCIVGAADAKSPADILSESTVHIGIILFAVVYGLLVLLTGYALRQWRLTGLGESRLIIAVCVTLPFLAVRVLYSLLAAFSHDAKFNPSTGSASSTTIALVMETLQEAVVVLVYLAAGLMVPKPTGDFGRENQRSWHGRDGAPQQHYALSEQQRHEQPGV